MENRTKHQELKEIQEFLLSLGCYIPDDLNLALLPSVEDIRAHLRATYLIKTGKVLIFPDERIKPFLVPEELIT